MEGHGKPGEVIDDELSIACGDNAIKPILVQKEGKKANAHKGLSSRNKNTKGGHTQ